MNIQRFLAPTAREALAKARLAFGEGTLILSNRPTATGVEVVATAEEVLAGLDHHAEPPPVPTKGIAMARRQMPSAESTRTPVAPMVDAASRVEDDAAQLAMSTLSFQDYVRERMLKRRHEASQSQAAELAEWEKPRPPQHQPTPKRLQRLTRYNLLCQRLPLPP